jgi:glycosyltransferase involved in cell wall biosynthesis
MRICHVAPELLPVPPSKGGAIERWIRDAAVRLVDRGHQVHVVSRDHGDGVASRTVDRVQYHYVRIPPSIDHDLPARLARGLWHYAAVRRLLSRIGPDIVHHHSRPAGLWLSHRAASRARHVISLHSMEYGWAFGHAAWDRRMFRRGFAAAARVLCVSNFIARHAIERYPDVRHAVATVYNGVDGTTFRPAAHASDHDTGTPTILYVGRVEERKGVHVLLDAFEGPISQHMPHARLQIVGPHSYWDANPSPYYLDLAARCAPNPRIELRGPTYVDEELAAVYRAATVSVVPSVFPEALGLTSLEAQASGVPVVVSDAGGLPETVSRGETGLVFENRRVEHLASAVLELLTDETRRRAMAIAARTWAMKTFSWDVIADQLEQIYAETVVVPASGAAS